MPPEGSLGWFLTTPQAGLVAFIAGWAIGLACGYVINRLVLR